MGTDNKVSLKEMRDILGQRAEDKPVGKAKVEDDGSVIIYETTLQVLGDKVAEEAKTKLTPKIELAITKTTEAEVNRLEKEWQERAQNTHNDLLALAESARVIEIKSPKATKKIKGVQHNQFTNLLTIVNTGQPVLMVGPAGTGKTHSAAVVADSLGLKFYSISVGSQTSKSDLQGYMDATHTYVPTQFRQAYEHGGIFLLDEADAGNSNVLILLNAALSNGYMAFPDGMIQAHEDFRMIATANTYGQGATRQYVGRNQLDAATLDRFVVLAWDIDDKVEEQMAGTEADGKKWLRVVRAVRKEVATLELRAVVSPRATLRGATLLAAGMDFKTVLPIALTGNLPASERERLTGLAQTAWAK